MLVFSWGLSPQEKSKTGNQRVVNPTVNHTGQQRDGSLTMSLLSLVQPHRIIDCRVLFLHCCRRRTSSALSAVICSYVQYTIWIMLFLSIWRGCKCPTVQSYAEPDPKVKTAKQSKNKTISLLFLPRMLPVGRTGLAYLKYICSALYESCTAGNCLQSWAKVSWFHNPWTQ